MDDRFFSSRLRLSGGRTSFLYPAPSRVETSNPASEMLLNWYVAQWDHTTSWHSDTYPSMRIGETNIPSDLRWGQSKVSTRRHWKLPTNIYPTRPTLYRLSQDLSLANFQLTSIQQILSLEWSSSTLGIVQPFLASHSKHPSRLRQHTGSSHKPSTRCQCPTPLYEIFLFRQDALMASRECYLFRFSMSANLVA